MQDTYIFQPIAVVNSPYKEKFGIPRQPGLAETVTSSITLLPEFSTQEIVRGLENCSHIWLLFVFSECLEKGWKPTVRPPRLGGNKRIGVFSSRSPFRPNPIGLSPVKLINIEITEGCTTLFISGADLLDGTPILDIKPYLPYSDSLPEASFPFAENIKLLQQTIFFSESALSTLATEERRLAQPIKNQITELLRCDPRPAYKKNDPDKSYGVKLHDLNIRFRITDEHIYVDLIEVTRQA
ncbi:tRNA (N6-threonylcarbamoyladenosine(37)-N6)-methyltransferase TrmO [Neptuniibacter sp. 1_MG-2023]|uniref:tRNA (N6-threonylcarbamoyladenosine(37)-N6)-methyltransferase TrmO n=1 Tax=Neptuniibacter sp. 1_MG-2023 TaxID=3062662 RepID=UPI0026E3B815|nr:tRNA (N6-threonylcarbamoyladenosine(37)-N6)-methyltransferase TrmO [Neptuniibacter sp. 1_MG-2023]MDO6592840.1 tRNA (N6-threonylcarbamoyladenosine(37)-N6)-methyltransferase TrmO [Neptuniibacter sp. 1_MG-2023]